MSLAVRRLAFSPKLNQIVTKIAGCRHDQFDAGLGRLCLAALEVGVDRLRLGLCVGEDRRIELR